MKLGGGCGPIARKGHYGGSIDVRTVLLPSRDILRQIMAGCFYHANTLGLTSLAFPLLGTGAGGFPSDVCLDTMLSFLIETPLYGAHTVQSVQVVLYANPPA